MRSNIEMERQTHPVGEWMCTSFKKNKNAHTVCRDNTSQRTAQYLMNRFSKNRRNDTLSFLQQFHTEKTSSRSSFTAVDNRHALDLLAQFMASQDDEIRQHGIKKREILRVNDKMLQLDGADARHRRHRHGQTVDAMLAGRDDHYFGHVRPKLQKVLAGMASIMEVDMESIGEHLLRSEVDMMNGAATSNAKKHKDKSSSSSSKGGGGGGGGSSNKDKKKKSEKESEGAVDTNEFTIDFDSSELAVFGIGGQGGGDDGGGEKRSKKRHRDEGNGHVVEEEEEEDKKKKKRKKDEKNAERKEKKEKKKSKEERKKKSKSKKEKGIKRKRE